MSEQQQSGSMRPGPESYIMVPASVDAEEIQRTLRTLEDAKTAGVTLRLGQIAVLHGTKEPSAVSKILQTVRHALPLVKQYKTPMERVREVQARREQQEYNEELVTKDLNGWLATLSGAELESVGITDTEYGDPYMSPLSLAVTGDADTSRAFHLKHSFGTDAQAFALLPEAVRKRLSERKEFWRGFGVETGDGVEEFITRYFEKIVLFSPDHPVEELAWLEAAHPDVYAQLRDLHAATGRKMHMWRMTKSPPSVVEDVLKIAVNTQEKFIFTWLEPWVKRERTPVILDSDVQALQVTQTVLLDKLRNEKHRKRSDFEQAVLVAQLEKEIADDADFQGSLTNIERLRSIVLGLEIAGPCDDAQRTIMDKANAAMDGVLSSEMVADRLTIDTVLHTSESIIQSLKALLVLVPCAEGLTWVPVPFIASAAKAVGCFDDLVAEVGEILSLRERGFKWSELKSRSVIILTVATSAVVLGTQVENIGRSKGERLAAFLFALTTFATTAATLGLNTHAFAKGYMRLAEQGKLQEQPYLNVAQRATLRTAVLDTEHAQHVRDRIDPLLTALADSPALNQRELEKRLAAIEAAARAGLADTAVRIASPSRREAVAGAYKEVFGTNPTRMGKLAAMPVMLGAAALLGGTLLSSPFIYVPYGMLETGGGLLNAKYADKSEGKRWRAKVHRHTVQARKLGEVVGSAIDADAC